MDAHGYPITCTDTLRLLRETAATLTPESTEETLTAAVADGPYPAFTSVTWAPRPSAPPGVITDSYFAARQPDAGHAATVPEQHEAAMLDADRGRLLGALFPTVVVSLVGEDLLPVLAVILLAISLFVCHVISIHVKKA